MCIWLPWLQDGEEEIGGVEDATEMVQGKPYHWKDWCIVRGRDCLYLWSDAAALELSNGSNGWFRFILDSKLATMYSRLVVHYRKFHILWTCSILAYFI
jgi:hypothetical protein